MTDVNLSARTKAFTSTPTHLVVSQRAVLAVLTGMALLGVVLGAVGLHDAYTRLGGADTTEGTIVTIAVAVAVVAVVSVVAVSQFLLRRATRPSGPRR